jgi:hypothetical protein
MALMFAHPSCPQVRYIIRASFLLRGDDAEMPPSPQLIFSLIVLV